MDGISELFREMDDIIARGAREHFGVGDDWEYRDLPKMQETLMLEFIQTVGEENLRWITTAKYPTGLVRGQILISPEGLRRVQEYIKKVDDHADPE